MAAKKKTTIDALAKQKARHEKRLKRKSALPAARSCIKGRSLAPQPVKAEKPKPTPEPVEAPATAPESEA